MKKVKLKIFQSCWITAIILSLFLSCSNGKDCKELPSSFPSYTQAIEAIKSSHFKIEETVNTSKSSWIRRAEYFSCDGKTGFFILKTDKREYIHADVPKQVWQGFKNADSFGSYYQSEIRGRYLFNLSH